MRSSPARPAASAKRRSALRERGGLRRPGRRRRRPGQADRGRVWREGALRAHRRLSGTGRRCRRRPGGRRVRRASTACSTTPAIPARWVGSRTWTWPCSTEPWPSTCAASSSVSGPRPGSCARRDTAASSTPRVWPGWPPTTPGMTTAPARPPSPTSREPRERARRTRHPRQATGIRRHRHSPRRAAGLEGPGASTLRLVPPGRRHGDDRRRATLATMAERARSAAMAPIRNGQAITVDGGLITGPPYRGSPVTPRSVADGCSGPSPSTAASRQPGAPLTGRSTPDRALLASSEPHVLRHRGLSV